MKTKSTTLPRIDIQTGHGFVTGLGINSYESSYYGPQTKSISYAEGPKYIDYRCNWKECHQTVHNGWSGDLGGCHFRGIKSSPWPDTWKAGFDICATPSSFRNSTKDYSLPDRRSNLSEAWNKVWQNLDLNTSDAVLLYSGILQAVPLVGGALNFVSIMNKAARKFTKSFKREPFTTVVKTAISADFIDRFVVSPTIDDARKFINAHNYVVNVMNTLYERSRPLPTAISMEDKIVHSSSGPWVTKTTSRVNSGFWNTSESPWWQVTARESNYTTSKVFLLAELDYNTSAVDPVKIWMNRVGITRPLDSVWDLIPFSFVIDYFTRAGDFISGLSDQMSHQGGLRGTVRRIHGAWQTTKNFNGMIYDIAYPTSWEPQYWPSSTYEYANGHMERGSYLFDRTPSNPFSYPPVLASDLVKVNLTSVRARTLLELFIQAKL